MASSFMLLVGLAVLASALAQQGVPNQGSAQVGAQRQGGQGGRNANQPSNPGRAPIPPPLCVAIPYLNALQNRFRRTVDNNMDGRATFEEVQLFLRKYRPNVRNETVAAFINRRDMNRDGLIDFIPEFVEDVVSPDYTDQAAREWFFLEDTNGDNFVSREELITIAQNIGFTRQQAEAAVDSYYTPQDKNKDGKLSFDEYKTLYSAGGKK